MIIQRVIKGIGGISVDDAKEILQTGIVCNWWRAVNPLPQHEVPLRLTDRNLHWHQNRYADPDPTYGNQRFGDFTPFISLTAGTVERRSLRSRHLYHPAWEVALYFATDRWQQDGFLFYCYVFVLGRKSVPHWAFSEELRDLNIHTGFSPFQPEGEITAKIIVPPTQIERFEFYSLAAVRRALAARQVPAPNRTTQNTTFYQPPEEISNIRDYLTEWSGP